MIALMVDGLAIGLARAVDTVVSRSSRNAGRPVSRRVLSGDVADQLVEALRYRRAEVAQLTAENAELRAELEAARRCFARRHQMKVG